MSYLDASQLLRRAHGELDTAHAASSLRDQFIHAHMAALRGAAAVLSVGTLAAGPARRKVRSAWVQLAEIGEEWLPWAEYYSASAATRAALESGQLRDVDAARVEEAMVRVAQFLTAVESFLRTHEVQFAALAQAS